MSTTQAKHTPGPWVTGNTDPLLFGRKQGNGMEPIGFVYGSSFPERSEVGQCALANARLIAAAPTTAEKAMAFTLIVERFLRGDVPQGVPPATEAEVAEAMYELRSHIAAATGEA